MSDYVISCCTAADLDEEYIRSRNISYTCMKYELDGKVYPDDLGKTEVRKLRGGFRLRIEENVPVSALCLYGEKMRDQHRHQTFPPMRGRDRETAEGILITASCGNERSVRIENTRTVV